MPIDILWLEWDDINEGHFAEHGVRVSEVNQVLGNPHLLLKNPNGQDDSLFLAGWTNGGRALSVVIAPTRDSSIWRPVTGFPATRHHQTLLQNMGITRRIR